MTLLTIFNDLLTSLPPEWSPLISCTNWDKVRGSGQDLRSQRCVDPSLDLQSGAALFSLKPRKLFSHLLSAWKHETQRHRTGLIKFLGSWHTLLIDSWKTTFIFIFYLVYVFVYLFTVNIIINKETTLIRNTRWSTPTYIYFFFLLPVHHFLVFIFTKSNHIYLNFQMAIFFSCFIYFSLFNKQVIMICIVFGKIFTQNYVAKILL